MDKQRRAQEKIEGTVQGAMVDSLDAVGRNFLAIDLKCCGHYRRSRSHTLSDAEGDHGFS